MGQCVRPEVSGTREGGTWHGAAQPKSCRSCMGWCNGRVGKLPQRSHRACERLGNTHMAGCMCRGSACITLRAGCLLQGKTWPEPGGSESVLGRKSV